MRYKGHSQTEQEFVELLRSKGYPNSNISNAVILVRGFMAEHGVDFTDENILDFDFAKAERYAAVNPALMLTLYRDWTDKGIEPEQYTRKRGAKDGLSRPCNCQYIECVYNSNNRCRYKPTKRLSKLLSWKNCDYYTKGTRERAKIEYKPDKLYADYIFSRKAIYKDAHSAMWAE